MAKRKAAKDDDDGLIVNAREPGLGVGMLVKTEAERRTYKFSNGEERSFKEAYCQLYIKPAYNVSPEVKAKLVPPPPPPVPVTPKAINEELEAQIRARPDEDGPYLVYADWLLQRQDPRGHLITVQSQRAEAPRNKALADAEKKLFDTHRTYFVPAALDAALRLPKRGGVRCEVTWKNGFLAHVRLARDTTPSAQDIDLDAVAKSVIDHPSAKFLRTLTIGQLGTMEYTYIPIIAAIAKQKHPLLAEIHVGDFGPGDIELASTRAGNISPLFKVAPAMTKLTVKAGSLRFDQAVDHAAIREIAITTTQLAAAHVKPFLNGKLPALEALSLVTEGLAFDDELLSIWTRGELFPALAHLALRGTTRTSAVLDALIDSPLLKHLETLDLSDGDFGDKSLDRLLARRASFEHLTRFDLGNNKLTAPEAQRLTRSMSGTRADRARFAITESDVVRKSPDKASLAAARKIAKPTKWMALGFDARRGAVWGEYEGSDHYYVFVHLRGRENGCGCGSPKNPCKHALALLLLAAHQHEFPDGPLPEAAARTASQWRPVYTPTWE